MSSIDVRCVVKCQVPIESDLNAIVHEISFMKDCHSEFVVQYYGSYVKDSELWVRPAVGAVPRCVCACTRSACVRLWPGRVCTRSPGTLPRRVCGGLPLAPRPVGTDRACTRLHPLCASVRRAMMRRGARSAAAVFACPECFGMRAAACWAMARQLVRPIAWPRGSRSDLLIRIANG